MNILKPILTAFVAAVWILFCILYLTHVEEIKHWYYMLVWGLD